MATAETTAKPKKKKKKAKGEEESAIDEKRQFEMKFKGDFMQPFTSFYDPKAMEPPLGEKQIEKIKAKIYKEVEIAIKQVRSSQNLNANIKNNHMTRTIMKKYMDYLEDIECCRILKPNIAKVNVHKELMKLVPENYKISMLPAFFNHTDGERIGTVIRDTSNQFLVDTPKKVLFSIAVEVFAYNSGVNSVRIVLVKFSKSSGVIDQGDEEDVADGKSKGSKKSKRSKSKKSRSEKGDTPAPQDAPPK